MIVTNRIAMSSTPTRIVASSFSSAGSAAAASPYNPVYLYLTNSTVGRCWIGGSSAVTTANGYVITTAGTTWWVLRRPSEMWGICSAAAATTFSLLFTNQPA